VQETEANPRKEEKEATTTRRRESLQEQIGMEEWTAAQSRIDRSEPPQVTQEMRQEKAAGEQQVAVAEHVLIRGQEEEPRELGKRFRGHGQKIPQTGSLTLEEMAGAGIDNSANPERNWLGETEVARQEQLQAAQESEEMMGLTSRAKEERRLARLLKTGTVLMPDEVTQIIWVSGKGVKGILETIDRLNSEIQEYAEYYPGEDEERIREQTNEIMETYEMAMLVWAQEEESDSDSGAE
jgi:hypothetical protein